MQHILLPQSFGNAQAVIVPLIGFGAASLGYAICSDPENRRASDTAQQRGVQTIRVVDHAVENRWAFPTPWSCPFGSRPIADYYEEYHRGWVTPLPYSQRAQVPAVYAVVVSITKFPY